MQIGSAWTKTKDGKKFMSCVIELPFIGKISFAIFPIADEDRKDKEKSPNASIVWYPPKSGTSSGNSAADTPFTDDDIPF